MKISELKEVLESTTESTWTIVDGKLIDVIHYPLMPEFLSKIWNAVPNGTGIFILKHNDMIGQVHVTVESD